MPLAAFTLVAAGRETSVRPHDDKASPGLPYPGSPDSLAETASEHNFGLAFCRDLHIGIVGDINPDVDMGSSPVVPDE